jgi:hypothetical protein
LALDFDEDLSSLGVNSFDYIRMAHLNGAVADERALLGKVFELVFACSPNSMAVEVNNAYPSLAVPATGHIEITFVDWVRRTGTTSVLFQQNTNLRCSMITCWTGVAG